MASFGWCGCDEEHALSPDPVPGCIVDVVEYSSHRYSVQVSCRAYHGGADVEDRSMVRIDNIVSTAELARL
jgi:hypothetical protein